MAKKSKAAGGTSLVIVESPAKARTISKFLGRDYTIEASIGHIRDLPQGAKEIPEQYKKEDWAYLGVDVNHDFKPVYVIPPSKSQQVRKLKALLKDAKELYLATDEDREGEAISWHLCEVLQPKVPVHRLVFHEITEEAIREALDSPRQIDENLVQAQEVRRIVDRLYGYDVSPLLWRKIRPRLSAGRVQSVAVRLIVERERQRMAFVSATFWDLLGTFANAAGQSFQAELIALDDRHVPAGRDFDPTTGRLKDPKLLLLDERQAGELLERLRAAAVPGGQSRRQAVHDAALSAVHHEHAATRGQPQVRLYRPAHHAGGPKPLRKRPHHLHANRFDHAGFRGDRGRAATGRFAIWEGISAVGAAPLSDQGQECPRGPRGDSARRARISISPSRSADASAPTSSSSTT